MKNRYTLRTDTTYVRSEYPYQVVDEKAGHTISCFRTLDIANQVLEYLNMKESMINKFYKDVSSDLDVEFIHGKV